MKYHVPKAAWIILAVLSFLTIFIWNIKVQADRQAQEILKEYCDACAENPQCSLRMCGIEEYTVMPDPNSTG